MATENVWIVWWKARSKSEQYGLLGAAAAIVLVAIGTLYLVLRPGYEVLFSGLNGKDISAIANQLAVEGLDYEIDTKGGRIMVAKRDVGAARIKVMERGLTLSGPVGFELFDQADFGMTDFTQQINYQRALEGELVRTVMALDEIEFARLHLVLPEVGLFRQKKDQPKASLTVVVKHGATLAANRVQGIQRLIAAAVPGLEPNEVTIHDQQGVALTRPADGMNMADAASERLEAKQLNEAYLTRKAQDVLDRAFGVGAAAVIVDASLDHDKRQTTREETLPVEGGVTGAVIRQRTSAAPRMGAVAQTTAAPSGITGAWPPVNAEVEYAVGRNVEQVETSPGSIRRLTVGVLVPRGVDQSTQTRMSELVASAVGLDPARGDVLSLQELPGTSAAAPASPGETHTAPTEASRDHGSLQMQVIQVASLAIAVLLLLGLVILRKLRRGRSIDAGAQLSAEERQRLLVELEAWLQRPTDGQRSGVTS